MTAEDINNHGYDLSEYQEEALQKLAEAVSCLEDAMQRDFLITSGLRTFEDQLRINPKNPDSAHRTGEAVDVSDPDGSIYAFCVDNVPLLIELGIYLEDKAYTRRYVHLTIRPPKSGLRFYIP